MKKRYFLRIGNDYLTDAEPHRTLADAKSAFLCVALELDRYGQEIEASIHIGTDLDDIVEYPDFILSLRRNGRVLCQPA